MLQGFNLTSVPYSVTAIMSSGTLLYLLITFTSVISIVILSVNGNRHDVKAIAILFRHGQRTPVTKFPKYSPAATVSEYDEMGELTRVSK